MCWKSQSLQTVASFAKILCIRLLVLELPTQWFKAVDNCHVTRDYRECFRDSRNSVGTPELKLSNEFIDALNYAGDPLIVLSASFENVLKIRYNDARLR